MRTGAGAKSIFVSIASYRDSEAYPTVEDIFAKAQDPDRIVVGICHQIAESDEKGVYSRPQQVRELIVPASSATGPCAARHRIQKELYYGEEFYLQFDSHMRLVPSWDSILIEELERCPSSKAVLSTYPAGYTLGPGGVATIDSDERPPFLVFSHFGESDGMMRFTGKRLARPQASPISAFFCVAGFLFARGNLISDGGLYDPNLPMLFFGEETLMTVRLWTHGWDFYSPSRHICYHLWERAHRPIFQKDLGLQELSLERVREILRGEITGEYGLGLVRNADAYFEMVGLDFKLKSLVGDSKRALLGGLSEDDFYQPEATLDAVMAILNKTRK